MINPLTAIGGFKDVTDYQRAEQEFEARKRQRMLEEQMAQGKLSMLPFEQQRAQLDNQALQKQIEMGISSNDPASIREWKIYSQLPKDQQERYLQMKRSDQLMNLGGNVAVRAPMGGIAEQYPVTPRPEQMPEFQAAQESARKQASGLAEIGTEQVKRAEKAGTMLGLVAKAREQLPSATSGFIEGLYTGTTKRLGKSTPQSKADAQLKVIAAGLTSNVPRMEGPQGVLDVELYKQAAGDVANSDLPYEDRVAALDTIEQLQNKYSQQDQNVNIPPIDNQDLYATVPKSSNIPAPSAGITVDEPYAQTSKYDQEAEQFNRRKGKATHRYNPQTGMIEVIR